MRNLRNKNAPPLTDLVQYYFDTAYDTIKAVYDAMIAGVFNISGDKSIIVENPDGAEDLPFFFTDTAITINKIRAVLVGSTPSVTWTLRHGLDRDSVGNEVIIGGTTTTEITTGVDLTTFDDASIPANSHVWFETTAKSGVVASIILTTFYDED